MGQFQYSFGLLKIRGEIWTVWNMKFTIGLLVAIAFVALPTIEAQSSEERDKEACRICMILVTREYAQCKKSAEDCLQKIITLVQEECDACDMIESFTVNSNAEWTLSFKGAT